MRFREQRCYDGVDVHAEDARGDAVTVRRLHERAVEVVEDVGFATLLEELRKEDLARVFVDGLGGECQEWPARPRPRASSLFSSPQTRLPSVLQRIPDMPFFLFSVLSQCDHNLRRFLLAASFDFAVARKGHPRPYNEVCFWSLILPHASGNRRVANPTISIWMKRRATFIVLKPHLRRMAGLLLKDGQTPLTSGKPSSMFTSPKMPSARFAPQSVAQRRLARIAAAFRMRTATMWPRVLEVLPAIMEIAREVSGFAADQSGEVRLGAAFS